MQRLKIFGSYFYQMQDLGLQALCIEDNGMHKYIRKLLALPLLPGKEISTQFQRLKLQATTETLQELKNTLRIHGSPTLRTPSGIGLLIISQ